MAPDARRAPQRTRLDDAFKLSLAYLIIWPIVAPLVGAVPIGMVIVLGSAR